MKRKGDIRDVARRAAVSTATVSRYLNDKRVSPENEQRILAAITEFSYSPNRVARSLRSRRTMTLAMVIPDITNPFFPAVVKAAEETARRAGFALMLFNAEEDEDREWECLRVLQALRCDGVLLIMAPEGPNHARRREQLRHLTEPIVYVDRAPDFDADMVVADNRHSGEQAVSHLIRLGHTRIAALVSALEVSVHRERVAGYRRALESAGLTPRPEYELRVTPEVADGYSAATHLLALAERPTALFATSNRLTIWAMAAIEAHGLRCPQDISLLGYDNYEWQDAYHPKMTTVAQPTALMGERAADLLISRIEGRNTNPPQRLLLQSVLIIRESSGPCRA